MTGRAIALCHQDSYCITVVALPPVPFSTIQSYLRATTLRCYYSIIYSF